MFDMPDEQTVLEAVRTYGLIGLGLVVFASIGAGLSSLFNDPALQRTAADTPQSPL